MSRTIVLLLAFAVGDGSVHENDLREWKSKAGTSIKAVFSEIDETAKTVTLLVPKVIQLSALSPESVEQARSYSTEEVAEEPDPFNPAADSPSPGLRFQVIKIEVSQNYKASYEIMIEPVGKSLPTKEQLADISKNLAGSLPHDRKFVGFFLPGMQLDSGYFATAHHNPELEVHINDWAIPAEYQ